MTHEEIYRKAIKELFHKTYGKLEHGEKKAGLYTLQTQAGYLTFWPFSWALLFFFS
jgi:hypothetical protein